MLENKKVLTVLCIIFPIVTISCTTSILSVSKLTTQQRRQITTQLIQGSYEDIFAATMTVLQDRNCVIKKTDMNTGLIFAKEEVGSETPAVEKAANVAVGILGAMGATIMGFDIESRSTDDVTLVEIGCVVSKIDDTASQLRVNTQESTLTIEETGTLWNKEKEYKLRTQPIYAAAYYRKLFNEITVEVKRREAIN